MSPRIPRFCIRTEETDDLRTICTGHKCISDRLSVTRSESNTNGSTAQHRARNRVGDQQTGLRAAARFSFLIRTLMLRKRQSPETHFLSLRILSAVTSVFIRLRHTKSSQLTRGSYTSGQTMRTVGPLRSLTARDINARFRRPRPGLDGRSSVARKAAAPGCYASERRFPSPTTTPGTYRPAGPWPTYNRPVSALP